MSKVTEDILGDDDFEFLDTNASTDMGGGVIEKTNIIDTTKVVDKPAGTDPDNPIIDSSDPKTDPVNDDTPPVDNDPANIDDYSDYALDIAKEIHEELGFEFDFDPEEFKETFGEGAEGIKNFLHTVVKESSTPKFETPDAQRYYELLSQGAKLEDISKLIDSRTSVSSISISDVEDSIDLQKQVVREYLKETNPGKTLDWIERKIERYVQSGILEDEAIENLEAYRDILDSKEKAIEERLISEKVKKEEETEKFWDKEFEVVKNSDYLAGVKVNNKLKQDFYDYYSGGKFHEMMKDPDIMRELAFVAFVGLDAVKSSATSKVYNDLDEKLRRTAHSRRSTNVDPRGVIKNDPTSIDYNDLGF
jgi:hypothetical protein